MQTISFKGKQIRKWTLGASTFLAWPEVGARLMNWNLTLADGTVRDIIHWPEDANMDAMAKVRGGNPVLFPFSARTFHDGQIYKWQDPEGVVRDMPLHGFARDGVFRIESINEGGFLAVLEPSEKAKEIYPYNYEFSVRYRFSELALTVDFILSNYDKKPLPWSAGNHFYFQLPWHAATTRKDYRIILPAKKAFHHNFDNGQLVSVKEFNEQTSFDDPDLIDRIHCKLKSNKVSFGPRSGEEDIHVSIGAGPSVPPWTAVTTWTEKPDSPFYCVEPWMGPPNSPEHKNGLHFVQPGKTEIFTVEVSLV